MRIFDRIASGTPVLPWDISKANSTVDSRWRKLAHTSTRVIGDESCTYVRDRGWSQHDASTFGALIPPFDKLWIEWRVDKRRQDAMVVLTTRKDDGTHSMLAMMLTHFVGDSVVHKMPNTMHAIAGIADTGEVISVLRGYYGEEQNENFNGHLAPGWLAIAWMNCRNLTLEQTGPNAAVRRKREKHGALGGLDYCRIVIEPKHRKRWEKSAGTSAHRFHTVRGHLARYTADKPLFGKYVGTFWKPSHTRGNLDLGRLNHEYHVQTKGTR